MAENAENATATPATQAAPKTDERNIGHVVAERADRLKYIVLAVIVVVIAAIAVVNYMRRKAVEEEIAARNDVFRTVVQLQTRPDSDGSTALAEAARKYAGTPAGASATMFQFAGAYNSGKYAEAEQAARDFIRTYKDNELVGRARLGLGQSLLMQDKLTEAAGIFRELVAMNDSATYPEAKLALAQTLEKDAESVRDNPEEYRRRLELAEAEYNDIAVRSRISSPAQRGFWPQVVTLSADFALVKIKDTLAGRSFGVPTAMRVGAPTSGQDVTAEDLQGVMAVTPPSPGEAGTAAPAGNDTGAATTEEESTTTPVEPADAEGVSMQDNAESSVFDNVGVLAQSAAETVVATAKDAGASLGQAARVASERAAELAESAQEHVASAAASTWTATGDVASRAREIARDAMDSASVAASQAGEYLGDTASRAVEFAEVAGESVANRVRSGARALTGSDERTPPQE